MKLNLLLLILGSLGVFLSCQKDDDGNSNAEFELLGKYKLVETLVDPGDGSGTFQSVDSDKHVFFYTNNLITSNGDLCSISIEADGPSSGNYSLTDSTFTSDNCTSSVLPYRFERSGDYILLIYPCFEGCIAKYKKF